MKTLLLLLAPLFTLPQTRFLTSEDFRGSQMRGFNVSRVQSYADLAAKNLSEIKATGANHIRVWVRIKHDSYNRYFFEYPTAIKATDSMLTLAEKQGLYVILTVEVLPRQGECDWWGNTGRKAGIKKIWVDSLARRYKDRKIIAAYDLMNEPRRNPRLPGSDGEYMAFTSDLINGIRAVDPSHVIVVEVLENQMLARVKPLPQKNLVYSPHGYSPLSITHQGVSTTAAKVYPASSGTYVANYFPAVSYWNDPAQFAKKYNAVIWVGEFSCINWAPKNLQGEWTSTRWIKDAIAYMESVGWSWSYHARREYQGWEADLPSAWYYDPTSGVTFTNGKPSKLPPSGARSASTPTMGVLTAAFTKNQP